MVKLKPKRWKGHCMLEDKWLTNGRKNWSKARAERKAQGRSKRFKKNYWMYE